MDNQTLPTKIKCLSALDLPPIHTQPSAERLLSILQSLAIQPSTFEKGENGVDSEQVREGTGGDAAGYLRYFTSTVKSPLAWIEDEGVREQIWDLASARMSERAGRTGMDSHSSLSGLCYVLGPVWFVEMLIVHSNAVNDASVHHPPCFARRRR